MHQEKLHKNLFPLIPSFLLLIYILQFLAQIFSIFKLPAEQNSFAVICPTSHNLSFPFSEKQSPTLASLSGKGEKMVEKSHITNICSPR